MVLRRGNLKPKGTQEFPLHLLWLGIEGSNFQSWRLGKDSWGCELFRESSRGSFGHQGHMAEVDLPNPPWPCSTLGASVYRAKPRNCEDKQWPLQGTSVRFPFLTLQNMLWMSAPLWPVLTAPSSPPSFRAVQNTLRTSHGLDAHFPDGSLDIPDAWFYNMALPHLRSLLAPTAQKLRMRPEGVGPVASWAPTSSYNSPSVKWSPLQVT